MPWTDRVQLAAPASIQDEANELAYLIDPDVGGDETFTGEATHSKDGSAPPTHIVTTTQLKEATHDALTTAGPMQVMDHIHTLAEERGRDVPEWDAGKIERVIGKIEVDADYQPAQEAEVV